MTDPKNKPDRQGSKESRMAPAIKKCRDLGSGSDTVMGEAQRYLPQHPKESYDNYQIRLRRPVFVNFFGRTISGLTGLVFRRDPVLGDDVPAKIKTWWENVDNKGSHGDVFSKDVFSDALEAGHAVIVVDIPRNTARNLGEEKALGIRPYWVHYAAEDVISTRVRTENGKQVLEQIVFRVKTVEPDGEFGEKGVVRYRQYYLTTSPTTGKRAVGIKVWEQVAQEGTGGSGPEYVVKEQGLLEKIEEIPAIFVYGEKAGDFQSRPPLLDLANLNLLHYQTSSDLYHVMHIADVPVPVITGAEGDVVISPNASLLLPEGATASYLEAKGGAIGHTSQQLKDLKGDMAVLGLSFLSPDKRAAETAEAKRIDKADSDSVLSAIARSLNDGLEQAFIFTAQLAGLGDNGGSVEINKDYEDATLTPEQITVYAKLVADGVLTQETLWAILIQGEVLPPDFDPEAEAAALEEAVLKATPPALQDDPAARGELRNDDPEDAELA